MTSAWKVTDADILSREEVKTIWSQLTMRSVRSKNARQGRVIFCLATFCGLRVSEICSLRLCDVKLAIPRPVLEIRPQIAKQHRRRTVPLWRLPMALSCLLDWKVQRREQGTGPKDYLICAQSCSSLGKPLDRRNARARFIAACGVLGKERQEMLTIHTGRHSCTSHLLAAGWPLPVVRDMLGHANMFTTSIYSHVVVDDLPLPDPFAFAGEG